MNQTVSADAPIPLIQFQNEQFTINPQAMTFLSNISQPIGILTIVGKYRTGKSLFLNKVLLNNANLFKVSPTINSCTKGLWMSKKTIKSLHPDTPNMDILIIDTEGYGATDQTDNYNNKILLLALLLSSYFIYNSVGSIDEKSLNNLNIITNLAKELQSKNMNNDKLEDQFPSFMWVVRDFTLKMVDLNDCQIQPRQYLEQALEMQKKTSESAQNKNKIRRMIKHFFKDRDCCTLVRPVQTEEQLQTLSDLDDSQFRPEFIQQITQLRNRILRRIKPKKIKGKCLSGEALLELTGSYIQALNNGSLPNIQSSWKHILNFETSKTISKILNKFSQKINDFGIEIRTEEQIEELKGELLAKSLISLKENLTFEKDVPQSYEKVKKQTERIFSNFKAQNKKKSLQQLNEAFNEYLCPKLEDQTMDELQKQMKEMQIKFKEKFEKNPCLGEFLIKHLFPYKQELIIGHGKSLERRLKEEKKQEKVSQEGYEKTIKQLQKSGKEMKESLYETERQLIMLKAKAQEDEKIKTLQISFLKKQLDEIKASLTVSQTKNENISSEFKVTKEELLDLKHQKDQANSHLTEAINDKKYYQKQIQILKNTIAGKNEEISHLKEEVGALNTTVEKMNERQEITQLRNKSESQTKSAEYQNLNSKYENSREKILELSKYVNKLQTEMQMKEQMRQKENNIQSQLFQSMKQNLKFQGQKYQEIIEINRNLSVTLKHMEERFQHAQIKEKQLKEYKKCVKNSSCLQCQNCSKFFVPAIFPQHLNICLIGAQSLKSNQESLQNTVFYEQIGISIKQTLLKDSDSKPYTEYVLELQRGNKIWTINRKYKSFCQLHSNLKILLPGVPLSQFSYIVNPQQGSKKSLLVEERRRVLQNYLKDLSANSMVVKCKVWKEFIGQPENSEDNSPQKQVYEKVISRIVSPEKENKELQKSPQQFLRTWNERNQRQKEITYQKSKKLK